MDTQARVALNPDVTSYIAATLDAHPLCEQVVHFLLKNEYAMDTVKGIASWWLGCEEMAARDALDRLVSCGVLSTHTLTAGTAYSLTRNPEIRVWLRATLAEEQPAGPRRRTTRAARRK